MSSVLLKRRHTPSETEDIVLAYLSERQGVQIVVASASTAAGISQDRFRTAVRSLVERGRLKRVGSPHQGWIYTVIDEPPPQYGRVNCPRCEVVGCTKHTATRLTNGFVGQVLGGW